MMVVFVDQQRKQYEVEPICEKIRIAPSSYYEHKVRERNSDRLPDRIKRDMRLELDIQRVWEGNFQAYGVRKVWRQLLLEGMGVARCTVKRLRSLRYKVSGTAGSVGQPLRMIRSIGQPATYSNPAKSMVGGRHHICSNMGGIFLCGFYNRCFCQIHCWPAGQPVIAHRFSTGCIGTSTVDTAENRGIN